MARRGLVSRDIASDGYGGGRGLTYKSRASAGAERATGRRRQPINQLTFKDAAKRLMVSEVRIQEWVAEKKIRSSGQNMIREYDLEKFRLDNLPLIEEAKQTSPLEEDQGSGVGSLSLVSTRSTPKLSAWQRLGTSLQSLIQNIFRLPKSLHDTGGAGDGNSGLSIKVKVLEEQLETKQLIEQELEQANEKVRFLEKRIKSMASGGSSSDAGVSGGSSDAMRQLAQQNEILEKQLQEAVQANRKAEALYQRYQAQDAELKRIQELASRQQDQIQKLQEMQSSAPSPGEHQAQIEQLQRLVQSKEQEIEKFKAHARQKFVELKQQLQQYQEEEQGQQQQQSGEGRNRPSLPRGGRRPHLPPPR